MLEADDLSSALTTGLQCLLLAGLVVYGLTAIVLLFCSNSFAGPSVPTEPETEKTESDMQRHAQSPNPAHRSLQRQPKGGEEARVVWLGRSGDCFVAGSPFAAQPCPYQLGPELQLRQVAAIERRYGGARRAQHAARTIQRAYREYSLAKKWKQVSNRRRVIRIATTPTEGGVMKTSSGTLVRMPPRLEATDARLLSYAGPSLRLHRYDIPVQSAISPRQLEAERRGSNPNHFVGHHSSRIQVRVSQPPPPAHYYQAGHLAHAAPPGVRIKVQPRASSAERHSGLRIQRSAASASAVRSQGAGAELQARGVAALRHQELAYSHRSDLASTSDDPYGAFPSPASPAPSDSPDGPEPWALRRTYLHSGQLPTSPATPRRSLAHQRSLPHFQAPGSPCSSSSDSTPSLGGPQCPPEPSPRPTHRSPTGRLVSAPIRRSSESPLGGLRARKAPAGGERDLGRRRQYRIALNFFNQKPERGLALLIQAGFCEESPAAVARFLLSRRGLAKARVGEYLGSLGSRAAQAVLDAFAAQVPMDGAPLDDALRHFLTLFRLPGEAQKIERIIQVFAAQYVACNRASVERVFRDPETVFVLAFAIIMLNTDLHTPNLRDDKRMKLDDFLKNLRGIDDGLDVDRDYLAGIYNRVKDAEFRPGSDHLGQVLKVDRSILASPKKPPLVVPSRRLVCYCRLYEVEEPGKKQGAAVHQRELFLFNDLLVVTKIAAKSRRNATVSYNFRQAIGLIGLTVLPFKNQYYPFGLRLNLGREGRTVHFQARSEDDRGRFMEDLREAIAESEEMDALRIQMEVEKQDLMRPNTGSLNRSEAQRDSGLPELEPPEPRPIRHRALSSSTVDLCGDERVPEPRGQPRQPELAERRLSLASDSGMSSTASVASRESSPKAQAASPLAALFK